MTTLLDILSRNGWKEHLQPFFESEQWNTNKHLLNNSTIPLKNSIFKPLTMKYSEVNCIIIGKSPETNMATGYPFEYQKRTVKQSQTFRFIEELEFAGQGFINSNQPIFSGLRSQGILMINDHWVLNNLIDNRLWISLTNAILVALSKKPRMVYLFLNDKTDNHTRIPLSSRFNHLILQGSLTNHFLCKNTVAELMVKTNEYLSKTNNQINWLQIATSKDNNLPKWSEHDELLETARNLSY